MAYWHYERLSALDAMFLTLEDPNVHMHVGAIAIFDADPLVRDDGSLDIDRVRAGVESSLVTSPRFRQRLVRTPVFRHPVWIDDQRFNIGYHVRHTSLPKPGGSRPLKRLAGRILSQKLDRGRPLWELWIVEGLEHGRFALIVKAHHCMVDGISGIDLLTGLMRTDPEPTVEPPPRWIPRPAPTPARLLADEALRRGSFPISLARAGLRSLGDPRALLGDASEAALSLGELLRSGLRPTSPTPLNSEIGPHRRFDWVAFDLDAIEEVREQLGGTLNDVVLSTTAGAIGRFLRRRGVRVDDLSFRVQVPMSIRTSAEHGNAGNRIVMLLADLPIAVRDPVDRLARVVQTTRRLKRSRQRAGVELLEEISDRTLTSIFACFARLATRQQPYNAVVTNIPGPPVAVYLLGARMREIYPLVPLGANQALGIALFSYDGRLYWGLNADWDAMPDLHDFGQGIELEFERLHKAARPAAGGPASAS